MSGQLRGVGLLEGLQLRTHVGVELLLCEPFQ